MAGSLTRRDLLHGSAALGITAALAAGCGSGSSTESSPTATRPRSTTPRRGGRVRVATQSVSTADTLDPAKGAISTDYARHYLLYSGLTQYDSDLRPQLALAEEIASDDQRTWHVRLRRGVEFHDGKPLLASDVVHSLLRHKVAATGSKLKTVAEQFQDVTADGPHAVRITLDTRNVDLPTMLADSHFVIVQENASAPGIGCGPFRLKEFKPGVRTVVTRNERYWRTGRPYLDEVELIGIGDEMSRVNALLSGDVHMINAVDPRSTRRIRESPGRAVLPTKSGLYTNLIMRRDAAQTGHPDFALAMKHLFDRETMRRALFRGYATIANDQPVPPGHPFFAQGLPQRVYDPERARFHLKRAGLLGIRLPVYASPAATGSVDMAALLQHSASDAGLNLAVNRVPADGYWSNHWMKHPLTFGNVNPRPTLDLLFTTLFKSDAPWNESGWQNERFDQLLIAARGEPDEARRRQMYVDMQVLIHEHGGIGIPLFIDFIDAYDTRVQGYGRIPIGGLMGYQFGEHVWLDA
jgi:peptide/nickel transport system substrate-binding protein